MRSPKSHPRVAPRGHQVSHIKTGGQPPPAHLPHARSPWPQKAAAGAVAGQATVASAAAAAAVADAAP